jgi:UDP-N-acetylglucosamine:LPS N-acetylglucosamine transferase
MDRVNELRKDTQRNELVDRATLRYDKLKDVICVMAGGAGVRYPYYDAVLSLEQALTREKVLEQAHEESLSNLEQCLSNA